MGEDRVKNQDQEGYRSLWEVLQSPVRDTVRARSLADLQTPHGFLDLLRVGVSESERAIPPCMTRGDGVGTLIARLVIFHSDWSSGFECRNPLVLPPLIEPEGHISLQAVDLSFKSGVPGDLSPPPQPVLQAYFVLNAGRYRSPWVFTWATFGSRCRQRLQHGAGEILIACVDCHPIVQFRIERNITLQVRLEFGPISAPEIRAIRWVMKG